MSFTSATFPVPRESEKERKRNRKRDEKRGGERRGEEKGNQLLIFKLWAKEWACKNVHE